MPRYLELTFLLGLTIGASPFVKNNHPPRSTEMGLIRRDIAGDVSTLPSTFSSFDNCKSYRVLYFSDISRILLIPQKACQKMSASRYPCCVAAGIMYTTLRTSLILTRIPFIVICVIGGLIVFSILWCFLRCCLCGYRCCACCCGGCGGRREKQKNQPDREILQPPPIIVQQPAYHQPPQYAYFDSHNDDALPVMPSFEKTQRIEIAVKEEHEMGPINAQDSRGYGYNQPPADLRFPNSGLQHPTPVRGYEQNGYDSQIQQSSNIGFESSMYSTVPPALQGLRHQEGGIPQQKNISYQEISGYHQQMQPGWSGHGNTEQNAHNDYQTNPYQYQGPRNQYAPDVSNYHNQRRQEDWAVV